jgi:DNA-directed RNA polymerase specialized sigma subunit
MTVSEWFKQYLRNVDLRDYLQIELKYCGRETIEAMQLTAYVMTDIPRSETNKTYQPTENIALSIDTINQDTIKKFREVTKEIEIAEKLINKLPERQRFVVREKYINGASWAKIVEITEINKQPLTRSTIKSDKKKADLFLQDRINEQLKIGKFIREVAI